VDIQMFNRLVKEMQRGGENIQKLRAAGEAAAGTPLVHRWYFTVLLELCYDA